MGGTATTKTITVVVNGFFALAAIACMLLALNSSKATDEQQRNQTLHQGARRVDDLDSVRRRLEFFDPKSVQPKVEGPVVGQIAPVVEEATRQQQQPPAKQQPPGQQQQEHVPVRPSSSEPSYLQLCRELLNRQANPQPNPQPFIVKESPAVCTAQESYAAMSSIMLSALIAQAGSKIRLSYQHNCHLHTPLDLKDATIQQVLPGDLTFGVGIGLQPIADKCTKCIPQFENEGRNLVECMAFPNPGILPEPVDPMLTSFRIAGFRHNIQQAVGKVRHMETLAGKTPQYGGATIVIDLESEISGKSWALPIYYYEDTLPKTISTINILVTQRCLNSIQACNDHSRLLQEGLQKLYPNARVSVEVMQSTALAYARIMDSPLLLCPPTLFCLLPSLYNEFSKKSFLVGSNNLYEWFKYVARENRKLMGKEIVLHDEHEVKKKSVIEDVEKLETFLKRKRPHEIRRRLTGMIGDPKTIDPKQEAMGIHENTDNSVMLSKDVDGYALDPTIPSYVHLCNELLNRRQFMGVSKQYIVHESREVCASPDTFSSLVTMMISSMIGSAGSLLRLSYQHGCSPSSTPVGIKTATIQQLMPESLTITKGIGINVAYDRCEVCVASKLSSLSDIIECFGFPVLGKMTTDPETASRMIPHFRHNVEAAVDRVHVMEAEQRRPTNAGAVVYIDTLTEVGHDESYHFPLNFYANNIPKDVSSIDIIVSERCGNCLALAKFVADYLHDMYPTARVGVEAVAGSAVAYARLIEAPIALCAPTTMCLLPALFKEFSHTSYIVAHSNLYPWFPYLADKMSKLGKSTFLVGDQELRPVTSSLNELRPFLLEPSDPSSWSCQNLRGRLGQWQYDPEIGRVAEYVTPLQRFRAFDFTPTADVPFRLATSYRWVDAICPVELTEHAGLCNVMQELALSRIYIVGDSLSLQMAQSLWKLMGSEEEPFRGKKERFQWSHQIQCSDQFSFELMYTRNDLIDNNDEQDLNDRLGDNEFNCGIAEICMPWMRNYDSFDGGTLLIPNVGSHVHSIDEYRTYMQDFFGLLESYQKPNDLVMFRSTVPGHENCQDPNVAPLKNYDEYLERNYIADFKSYHLFPTFNNMVEEQVRELHPRLPGLSILNVTPMTILRPDGHTSGPNKCSTCKDDDCLHYTLPGPIDWWNHLLYSNLINLAQARRNSL